MARLCSWPCRLKALASTFSSPKKKRRLWAPCLARPSCCAAVPSWTPGCSPVPGASNVKPEVLASVARVNFAACHTTPSALGKGMPSAWMSSFPSSQRTAAARWFAPCAAGQRLAAACFPPGGRAGTPGRKH
ncbi:unnamed protein product [Symbiodinium natans]|uniref:Uncharacterized protein n=1 Tax=Symbiodinium natans TaxID=878477 RepID=A0A812QDJ3_9DINO|nr:unnamed protein product [Symbiodinium natans]